MGTIKAVIGFVVVVGVIYAAFQIIPPEMANYSFQDDLRDIAMSSASNFHITDEDVLQQVIKKGQEHQISLTPQQVTVQHMGTPGAPAIYVAADYNVSVNLPGYSLTLHFTPSSGNRGF